MQKKHRLRFFLYLENSYKVSHIWWFWYVAFIEVVCSKVYSSSQPFVSVFFKFSICSFIKKCTKEKTLVPTILNFHKIKQELADLLGPKISKKGKFYFQPCFHLFKKIELGHLENDCNYLDEKEGEAIAAIRNKVFHDSFLYWNSLLIQIQIWIRSLPTSLKSKHSKVQKDKFV